MSGFGATFLHARRNYDIIPFHRGIAIPDSAITKKALDVVRKLVDGVSILNLGRGHDMEQVHRLLEKGVFQ